MTHPDEHSPDAWAPAAGPRPLTVAQLAAQLLDVDDQTLIVYLNTDQDWYPVSEVEVTHQGNHRFVMVA